MTATERARSAARVAPLAAVGVGAGAWLGGKGVALAAIIGAASAVALGSGPQLVESLWVEDRGSPPLTSVEGSSSLSPERQGPSIPSIDALPSERAGDPAASSPGMGAPGMGAPGVGSPGMGEPAGGSASPDPERTTDGASAIPAGGAPTGPAASAATADTLAAETALLERARVALERDPSRALSLLEQHLAAYPTSQLGIERELLIVDALARRGRTAEARARGESLLDRTRGGIHEGRVRALLESLP